MSRPATKVEKQTRNVFFKQLIYFQIYMFYKKLDQFKVEGPWQFESALMTLLIQIA